MSERFVRADRNEILLPMKCHWAEWSATSAKGKFRTMTATSKSSCCANNSIRQTWVACLWIDPASNHLVMNKKCIKWNSHRRAQRPWPTFGPNLHRFMIISYMQQKNLRRHETGERISFMNIVKARRDQMPRCSICFVLCLELSFPSLCGLQRTQPPEPNSIMLIFDYKNMNNELRSFAGDIELIFLFRARADQAQIEKGISVVELPSWASICHDIGSGRRFDFTFAT